MFGTFTELVVVPFIGWYTTLASSTSGTRSDSNTNSTTISRNLPKMLGSKSACIVLAFHVRD